jgi:hypothetical protein
MIETLDSTKIIRSTDLRSFIDELNRSINVKNKR